MHSKTKGMILDLKKKKNPRRNQHNLLKGNGNQSVACKFLGAHMAEGLFLSANSKMAEIKILCFSLGVIRNEYIRGSVNVRCFENKSIGQTEMDRYRRGLVNISVQVYGFWKCQAGEPKGDQM